MWAPAAGLWNSDELPGRSSTSTLWLSWETGVCLDSATSSAMLSIAARLIDGSGSFGGPVEAAIALRNFPVANDGR